MAVTHISLLISLWCEGFLSSSLQVVFSNSCFEWWANPITSDTLLLTTIGHSLSGLLRKSSFCHMQSVWIFYEFVARIIKSTKFHSCDINHKKKKSLNGLYKELRDQPLKRYFPYISRKVTSFWIKRCLKLNDLYLISRKRCLSLKLGKLKALKLFFIYSPLLRDNLWKVREANMFI